MAKYKKKVSVKSKYPPRKVQVARLSITHKHCRAFGHQLRGVLETYRRQQGNDEVVYIGFRQRVVECTRNIDKPCGYRRTTVYDGTWGYRDDLSFTEYDPSYGVKGRGRGNYRVEALQELEESGEFEVDEQPAAKKPRRSRARKNGTER